MKIMDLLAAVLFRLVKKTGSEFSMEITEVSVEVALSTFSSGTQKK